MVRNVLENKKICVKCGTTETSRWYGFKCVMCYRKYFWANYKTATKKQNDKRNPRKIRFKGKRITLNENPRKGICEWCGKTGETDIHHLEYHDDNPLKDTVEICNACHCSHHAKQHWQSGKFANRQQQPRDTITGRFIKK